MLDLNAIPKRQDAQRAAEWLVETGVETILCVPVEELNREAQAAMVWWDPSRLALILGAEVVELREQLKLQQFELAHRAVLISGLEQKVRDLAAKIAARDAEIATLQAGLEAHAAGLEALSAVIERAIDEEETRHA